MKKKRLTKGLGLDLMGHHLVYSPRGVCGWLPYFIRGRIVAVWNFFSCRMYGHYWIGELPWPAKEDECAMCLKKQPFKK